MGTPPFFSLLASGKLGSHAPFLGTSPSLLAGSEDFLWSGQWKKEKKAYGVLSDILEVIYTFNSIDLLIISS